MESGVRTTHRVMWPDPHLRRRTYFCARHTKVTEDRAAPTCMVRLSARISRAVGASRFTEAGGGCGNCICAFAKIGNRVHTVRRALALVGIAARKLGSFYVRIWNGNAGASVIVQ
jgi:hypothetical protein